MKRLLCILSLFFLVAACAERPTAVEEDGAAPLFKKVVTGEEGTITFGGEDSRSFFEAYFPRSGTWFLPPGAVFCNATATLTFVGDGHDIEVTTSEGAPCADTEGNSPRDLTWTGTMTSAGAVTLYMQEDQGPLIEQHTGCTLSGTFPVYHGHFDGEILTASGHFHGHCGTGGEIWSTFGFPQDGPGPVNVTFGLELHVVQ